MDLVDSSPWLFAVAHVLLRLQAPRHAPLTLYNLENIDARARYGILKGRTTRAPVRNHLNTDRWKGAERAGERPADPQRVVGVASEGLESPRAAQ